MFIRSTAIFLIFTVLIANFTRLFIYAGFELNQKYIASTLCENISKPQLHCNGKCYLSKKLKQEAEKEKKQERQSQKTHIQEACITEKIAFKLPVRLIRVQRIYSSAFDLPQHSSVIFHPPQA